MRDVTLTYPDGKIVPAIANHSPMPHHLAGLSYTRTGYGSRLPMPYKITIGRREYRVYAICYGNIGTAYITIRGSRIIVD